MLLRLRPLAASGRLKRKQLPALLSAMRKRSNKTRAPALSSLLEVYKVAATQLEGTDVGNQEANLINSSGDITSNEPTPPRAADLLTASKAIRALQTFFGGRRATKELLVDLLIDGEIRAYARYQWVTGRKSPRAARKAGPPEDAIERAPVKASLLVKSTDLHLDMQQWRWRRRRTFFHVTLRRTTGRVERHFFQDVRFRKSDIVGLKAEMTKSFRERYKGGRRFDEKRWRAFWVEFALLLRDGKIGPEQMKKVGAFQKFVWDAYVKTEPEDPLDFETIKMALSEALDTLKNNPPISGEAEPK